MYKEEILSIVCDITNNKKIQYDTNLLENVLVDSLEILRIIIEIEEKYSIKFDMFSLDMKEFESVNKISNLVSSMKTQ